ncbi:MAG: hypothetical protein ING10_08615 [Roseomonas sp.]|nr:hypothetical protein [Roseomonas sp.]
MFLSPNPMVTDLSQSCLLYSLARPWWISIDKKQKGGDYEKEALAHAKAGA